MRTVKLYGKYAEYMKFLGENEGKEENFRYFSTFAEAYYFSALYGCLNGRYILSSDDDDKSSSIEQVEIKPEQLDKYRKTRTLILLTESASGRDNSRKIDCIFRKDYKDMEEQVENDNIIKSFSKGGLEALYFKLQNVTTKEDAVRVLNDMITNLAYDCGFKKSEESDSDFDDNYA